MSALSVDGLTRRFGDLVAVNNLTFEVPAGGVVGFVGPNGSGKSTTIRMLLGLIAASSGTGTVLGEPIEHPERFASRVGALIEGPAFVGGLTGKDNLRSVAALRGLPGGRVDEVLKVVGLTGREDDKASTYSLGMKQRLGLAVALLPDPELVVLDEPTNGLDPAGIVEIRELLKSWAAGGELMYAGSLEGLMAKATERVVAAPEFAGDMPRLVEVVRAQGWTCEVSAGELIIDMPAERSAELGHVATAAGLTLRMLNPEADTLEAVFLRLTGATDAELSEQRRAQRQGEGA